MNTRISGIASVSTGIIVAMRIIALSLIVFLSNSFPCEATGLSTSHYPSKEYTDYVHSTAAGMPLLELKQWADSTYFRSNDRLDAEPIYKEVLARAVRPMSEDDEKLMAAAYSNYATLLIFERNNPMQAYPMLKRSLELAEKYRDEGFSLIGAYTNMSHIYANFNDTVKALNYLQEGFDNARRSSKPERSGYIYAQLMLMAWDFDKTDAVTATMEAFKNDSRLSKGYLYRYNLELTHAIEDFRTGRFTEAMQRLKTAAGMVDSEYDHDMYVSMTLLMAAEAAIKGGDAPEARTLIDEAATHMQGYEDFNGKIFFNKVLSEYYRLVGDYKAAAAYDLRSLVLRDSLYSARNMTAISDLEQDMITSRYNTELKEAELQQQILREKNARQRSLILVISLSSAVIITLLLFLIYKRRKLTECRYDLFLKNVDLPQKEESIGNSASDVPPEESENDSRCLAETFDKVKDFLSHRPEVFDPAFSIDTMSELSGIPIRIISRAINRYAGKNFSLFVGDYRIREACRILIEADPDGRPTIEAVAEKVGYRSRSHFSRTFKAVTGLTTTEFIRQSQTRSSVSPRR